MMVQEMDGGDVVNETSEAVQGSEQAAMSTSGSLSVSE